MGALLDDRCRLDLDQQIPAGERGDAEPGGGPRSRARATLCYMKSAHQVGVRELRQNLSKYLHRVTAGERFEVTEHNLPVAILAPLPGRSEPLERLAAEGRIVPARLDLTKLGPPPDLPHEMSISEALEEMRGER